jgi:serine/threonine protein phosphatase 1
MSRTFNLKNFVARLTGGREAASDETCIYAVGDVHGRSDLLIDMCHRIDADIELERPLQPIQVFLGDYIDRGPDSAGVIAHLAARQATDGVVCLRGNHEACLLGFLTAPETLIQWRQFGALQTLVSYGLSPSANPNLAECRELAETLLQTMPPSHLDFLRSLPTSFDHARYFFAHAGIRPGVPLDRQREEDLLWIRNDFLLSEDDFGKIIVHGHTPVTEPELHANRINIDTGAYASNRLTCIRLRGTEKSFL